MAALLLAAVGLLAAPASLAKAGGFDHFTTGFDLVGQHQDVPCESCHVGGIFKGTPTDCFSCHAAGSRIGASAKPTNHILSSNDCGSCHTTYGWRPVAMFNHINVLGTCSSCHNGVQTVGKGPTHIATTAECSTCHLVTLPWKSAHFDHTGITDNCVRCHDNTHAPGKPPKHIPASNLCEGCHLWQQPIALNYTTFVVPNDKMNHSGITNNCQACHETGMAWDYVKVMVDRPTPAQDPNHPLATAPGGADCSSCHSGFGIGDFNKANKPANHIPTKPGALCVACHDLSNMAKLGTLGAIHSNAPSSTTNCTDCHLPEPTTKFDLPAINFHVLGVPVGHVPIKASCEACHLGSSFPAVPVQDGAKFTNSKFAHLGYTADSCAQCHGPNSTAISPFIGVPSIVTMPPSGSQPGGPTLHLPSTTTCGNCHAAPTGLIAPSASGTVPGGTLFGPSMLPGSAAIHSDLAKTTTCKSCHERDSNWLGMTSYPATPNKFVITTQYSGFVTRPYGSPSPFSIVDAAHPTDGDCGQCHTEALSFKYFDSAVKPTNHIPYSSTATCSNCHIIGDFSTIPSVTNIHSYLQNPTTNCAQCHEKGNAASFAIPAAHFYITSTATDKTGAGLPATHLPTTQSCEICHLAAGAGLALPIGDTSTFAKSMMNHQGSTTCNGCHEQVDKGITTFLGISQIVRMPTTSPGASSHIPTPVAASCEVCHLSSMPATVIGPNSTQVQPPGTQFMPTLSLKTATIHTNIAKGCQACHESTDQWLDMSLYPISPTAASSDPTVKYTGFQLRPGAAAGTYTILDALHPKAGDPGGADCESCHGTNFDAWTGQVKPANHIPYVSGTACTSCHTTTDFSASPTVTNIHKYAQSTTTNCAQCHDKTNAAYYAIPAAKFAITSTASVVSTGATVVHMPVTQSCEVCHVGAGSSVTVTPVATGAAFAKSLMNHQGVTTCAECHAPPVTATTFSGITKLVVMPPTSPAASTSHIPTSTSCESCHLSSMPSGLIAANATTLTLGGTKFLTPAPKTDAIHSGISANCQNCHEGGYVWAGMTQYQIAPTQLSAVTTTQYTGFQTRPSTTTSSTYMLKDANHPTAAQGADCVTCHTTNFNYFAGSVKPANHIPYVSTALCTDCHTNISDFSVAPTLTNIHKFAPSTTSNCIQCHGASQSLALDLTANPTYHITSTTRDKTGIAFTPTHMPTAQSCEVCHVGAGTSVATTPVVDGASFANSTMNHTGTATGCAGCHTVNGAVATKFLGVTNMVGEPPTTGPGAGNHLPTVVSTCETCHLANVPSGAIAPNSTTPAPGSKFKLPFPQPAAIHTGVTETTGCGQCHEANQAFMSIDVYPIQPSSTTGGTSSTLYTGFQQRPGATVGTYVILDALHPLKAAGDCWACHGMDFTTGFIASGKPSNHYPTTPTAPCADCHVAGNYADYSKMNTANPTVLTAMHNDWLTPTACSSCHADTTATYAAASGFAIMRMDGATPNAWIHIPITNAGTPVECSGCHKSTTAFSGTVMSHTAIGDFGSMTSGSKNFTAVATGNACDACHEVGMKSLFKGVTVNFTRDKKSATHELCGSPGTYKAPNVTNCGSSGGSDCLMGCHQHTSISATYKRVPRKVVPVARPTAPPAPMRGGRPATLLTATGAFDHSAAVGETCQSCHVGGFIAGKGPGHPKTTDACADCHSTTAWIPVARLDHADVLDRCVTCHNGKAATGKSPGHILSDTGCERCHTTSAWKPATVDHSALLAANCISCHNGLKAVGKPTRHVLTTESCETCHYVLSWTPVKPVAPKLHRLMPPARKPAVPPRGRLTGGSTPPSEQ